MSVGIVNANKIMSRDDIRYILLYAERDNKELQEAREQLRVAIEKKNNPGLFNKIKSSIGKAGDYLIDKSKNIMSLKTLGLLGLIATPVIYAYTKYKDINLAYYAADKAMSTVNSGIDGVAQGVINNKTAMLKMFSIYLGFSIVNAYIRKMIGLI